MPPLPDKLVDKYDLRGIVYFVLFAALFSMQNLVWISRYELPVIALVIGLVFFFNDKSKLKIDPGMLVYSFALVAIVFLASISAKYPDHALQEANRYRDVALFALAIYLSVREDLVRYFQPIFLAIIFAFLVVTPVTLWEYYSFVGSLTQQEKWITTDLTYFAHIRHFSYFAFLTSVLAGMILLHGNRSKPWAWIVLGICVTALVASGGRAAILSLVVFFTLYALFTMNFLLALRYMAISLLAIAVILGLIALSPFAMVSESLIERSSLAHGISGFLSYRTAYWELIWNASFDRPIFGYGPGGFKQIPDTPLFAVQPHGVFPQVLVEFGWVGGSLLLLCLLQLGRQIVAKIRNSGEIPHLAVLYICAIAAYLTYALVDGNLYYPQPMSQFAVLVVGLIVIANNPKLENLHLPESGHR